MNAFKQLEQKVDEAMFDASKKVERIRGTDDQKGKKLWSGVLASLNKYLELFVAYDIRGKAPKSKQPAPKTHSALTNHFFDTLMCHVNAVILNGILSKESLVINTQGSFDIKMNLNNLENWLEENGFFYLKSRFSSSKQAADVLLIRQKNILVDGETRSTVCPDLTDPQLVLLLRHFDSENDKVDAVPESLYNSFNAPNATTGLTPKQTALLPKFQFQIHKYHVFERKDSGAKQDQIEGSILLNTDFLEVKDIVEQSDMSSLASAGLDPSLAFLKN